MPKIIMENNKIESKDLGIRDLLIYLLRYSYISYEIAIVPSSFLKRWNINYNNNTMQLKNCLKLVGRNNSRKFENEIVTFPKESKVGYINWSIVDDRGKTIIKRKEIKGGLPMKVNIVGIVDSILDNETIIIEHDAKNVYSITRQYGH